MKKLFSTILAVMVAVVMAFAVFAFTGCDPTNPNPNPDPEPNPKPATGLVTGNATYDGIIGTEYAGFKLASTVSMGGEDATVNATVNTNGKADILMEAPGSCMYYFMRDWKVYGTDSSEAITDFSQAELYGYVDINQFIESMLEYVGENGGMEIPAEVTGLIKLDKILEGSLGGLNYAVISLADAANAVTVNETDKTVTVDFNKMAYNMVNQVKAGVTSLKGDTTLSELLGNATLKKYAQIITELVSTEDVINYVADLAKTLGELGNATETLEEGEITGSESGVAYVALAVELINDVLTKVQPDENSSVYDYIVKVLSSQELLDAINGLLQKMGAPAGSGLTKKISEFTLSEIIGMIPTEGEALTLDGLKEMINGYITAYTSGITETALTVSYEDDGEEVQFSVTGAKLVYTYGANGLTAMDLDLNIAVGENFEMGIDATLTLSKTAYAADNFVTLPANLTPPPEIDFGDLIPSPGPNDKYDAMLSVGTTTVTIDPDEDFYFKVYLGEEYAGQEVQLRISSDDSGLRFAVENNSVYDNPLEVTYSEDLIIDAWYLGEAEDGLVPITIEIVNGDDETDPEIHTFGLGNNEIEIAPGGEYYFSINLGSEYADAVDVQINILSATSWDLMFAYAGSDVQNYTIEGYHSDDLVYKAVLPESSTESGPFIITISVVEDENGDDDDYLLFDEIYVTPDDAEEDIENEVTLGAGDSVTLRINVADITEDLLIVADDDNVRIQCTWMYENEGALQVPSYVRQYDEWLLIMVSYPLPEEGEENAEPNTFKLTIIEVEHEEEPIDLFELTIGEAKDYMVMANEENPEDSWYEEFMFTITEAGKYTITLTIGEGEENYPLVDLGTGYADNQIQGVINDDSINGGVYTYNYLKAGTYYVRINFFDYDMNGVSTTGTITVSAAQA